MPSAFHRPSPASAGSTQAEQAADLTVNVEKGVTANANLRGGKGQADLVYLGSGEAVLQAGTVKTLAGGTGQIP